MQASEFKVLFAFETMALSSLKYHLSFGDTSSNVALSYTLCENFWGLYLSNHCLPEKKKKFKKTFEGIARNFLNISLPKNKKKIQLLRVQLNQHKIPDHLNE